MMVYQKREILPLNACKISDINSSEIWISLVYEKVLASGRLNIPWMGTPERHNIICDTFITSIQYNVITLFTSSFNS